MWFIADFLFLCSVLIPRKYACRKSWCVGFFVCLFLEKRELLLILFEKLLMPVFLFGFGFS